MNENWEVENDGERCFVCGDKFQKVNHLHLNKHDMNFRDYFEYCNKNGFESRGHKILEEIRQFYQKSENFTAKDFEEKAFFSLSPVKNWFGTWNNAIKKCDIPLNEEKPYSDKEIFSDMKRIYNNNNKESLPSDLYKQVGSISVTTIQRRFGTWKGAKKKAGIND